VLMPRVNTSWTPDQPRPRNADRKTLAAIITHELFPISPRTIERWPLVVRKVNGRAICKTSEAIAMAEAKMAGARSYKLGAGRLP
jgi:hypothetical protein